MSDEGTSGAGPSLPAEPPPGAALRSTVAVVLAWLLPGLGHFYLGRKRRAMLFGGIVLFMFWFGLFLDGRLATPVEGSYLASLASLADLGVGPCYFLADFTGWGVGRVTSATHEVGNTFHWSAGVMNMLLLLDVYDIAHGRK